MRSFFNFIPDACRFFTRYKNRIMSKLHTLEDYYAHYHDTQPVDLKSELGHFNVFPIHTMQAHEADPVTYSRKDYFKICMTTGKSRIHYADKTMVISQHALLFANPLIPYNWEPVDAVQTGFSCIFSESFFHNYGRLKDYPVFKPGGVPVYELNQEEAGIIAAIFRQMVEEKDSQFEFRNDVLRNLVFQLIHSTLKMRPALSVMPEKVNAATRIYTLFLELLEKQFPVRNSLDGVPLRSASDFADQLAIHVNHLNKSVKEASQKTTSELIGERILKEARILLKHSRWTISEIAFALGFDGPNHFSSFFKKHQQITPSQFRNA